MPKYDAKLLDKIIEKTGLARSTIYRKIEKIELATGAPDKIAALILAQQSGIPIKRLSTSEDRSKMAVFLPRPVENSARQTISGTSTKKKTAKPKPKDAKQIFMIHGRNAKINKAMHAFLRSLGLNPLEFQSAIHKTIRRNRNGGNPYIGEVLDNAFEGVKALIVLFTPDDEVQLRKELWSKGEKAAEKRLQPQPRPNVIFEAGMALGRHEEKTLFVSVGKSKSFSDIAGRHMLFLNNSPEKRKDFAERLRALGCDVRTDGIDWLSEGDLTV